MKDQYDNIVPDDLVVLDVPMETLSVHDIARITSATWYVWSPYESGLPQIILVSAKAIDYLTETDPKDCGIDLSWAEGQVFRVDEPLKRWSIEDGFYHA